MHLALAEARELYLALCGRILQNGKKKPHHPSEIYCPIVPNGLALIFGPLPWNAPSLVVGEESVLLPQKGSHCQTGGGVCVCVCIFAVGTKLSGRRPFPYILTQFLPSSITKKNPSFV